MSEPARRENFLTALEGHPVDLYTLRNGRDTRVAITNYGARIVQIVVPDRSGPDGDVVLGYDSIDAFVGGYPSMNAFIGRFANRIGNASFVLDGTTWRLSANDGRHTLHGGARGSRVRVFDATQLSPRALELLYTFDDGEEGFPGTLPVRVVYTLDDDDALTLEWSAVAMGRATIASFTGHAFFNLCGDPRRSIEDHVLTIAADGFLPVADRIPTGEIRPVAGTPMDFRQPKRVGEHIDSGDDQLIAARGYDHYFVLRSEEDAGLRFAARVEEPTSGRVLEVWTTEPGVQFFSGNSLGADPVRDAGKGGRRFAFRGGLCLEPSRFPDAPNQPRFPSCVVRPGQTYRGRIVYRLLCRA